MSLSNFVVFFISALSHFPSANFTNTHTLQELQIRVKDIWCLQWIGATGNDKLIWLCCVDSSAEIPLLPMFFLIKFVCAELVSSLHLFSFQRFAHWNWNQEKKLPGIITVSLWTFTFYLPPPFSWWKDHIWCSFFPALNLSDIYITFADLSLASWINNLPGRGEQKQFCLGSIPYDKTIFIFYKATKTQIQNTKFKEITLKLKLNQDPKVVGVFL